MLDTVKDTGLLTPWLCASCLIKIKLWVFFYKDSILRVMKINGKKISKINAGQRRVTCHGRGGGILSAETPEDTIVHIPKGHPPNSS